MNPQEREMIANARAAYKRHDIDRWQLWDVYFIVARAMAERTVWNQCIYGVTVICTSLRRVRYINPLQRQKGMSYEKD